MRFALAWHPPIPFLYPIPSSSFVFATGLEQRRGVSRNQPLNPDYVAPLGPLLELLAEANDESPFLAQLPAPLFASATFQRHYTIALALAAHTHPHMHTYIHTHSLSLHLSLPFSPLYFSPANLFLYR